MSKILFTQAGCRRNDYYPFSLTRRIQDMVVGAFSIRQKWELALETSSVDLPDGDFDTDTDISIDAISDDYLLLQANVLPSEQLVAVIDKLQAGEAIICNGAIVVYYIDPGMIAGGVLKAPAKRIYLEEVVLLHFCWQIPQLNKQELINDFALFIKDKTPGGLQPGNAVSDAAAFFIHPTATAAHCIFNTTEGPIFIDEGAVLMEGSLLRGPVYIGKNAVVKMGAKIYGATTISAGCTVGGEIKNSVFFANSNKAHDGYVGDAVIGAWCNFGAGASNSNVKNNAGEITVWLNNEKHKVGLKCGVMMGDYSRVAINTSINTGTVIGACANVFGNGLTPAHIPSFSWGYDSPLKYKLDKAFEHINNWMQFKKAQLTTAQKQILEKVFNQ